MVAPVKFRLAVLITLTPLLIATAPVRVVHYGGDTATIETQDRTQHIVVRDRHGNLVSETTCDWQTGTFDQIVALGQALKRAALRGDRYALVSLVQFPLNVNIGPNRPIPIASKRDLLARYSRIFTPNVIASLQQNESRDVFCRNGMSWVAGGIMWATIDRRGRLRVAVINR
jgi:hypothetical protein